ncbi:MAG: HAMP domain-containing histidine kinase [Candidatus Bathyarchaeota archaeon]|nr:HAMP domain-containing histidine kinase [Candidatus Bathyarchaeota archaeon]
MLTVIDNAIDQANRIISDLLDYSREMHLEPIKCTPLSLLKETLSMIQAPSNIKIENHTLNEPEIEADVGKMVRVFTNMVKNAIDAMPNGGTLEIRSAKTNGNVNFTFRDTGTGISEEVMAKLFTPLFTTKAKDMGFGLAICKRVVEAHGGKITVESIVGEGATFTITLPLEPKLWKGR